MKRRRIMTVFAILFALACSVAGIAACGGKPDAGDEAGEYYREANGKEDTLSLGGDGKTTYSLKIGEDERAGDYTLQDGVLSLLTEGDPITGNYLGGTVELSYGEAVYIFYKKIDYTVHFDTDGGSAVSDAAVMNGKTAQKPAAPEKEGYAFIGWYSDADLHDLYDFGTPVTGDLTLYARFEAKIEPEFTVAFDANGGSCDSASAETVGHKLYSLPVPSWEGHTFVGWWKSDFGSKEELTCRYTDGEIEENTTLYAVWEGDAPAVSVDASGVEWTSKGNNATYTVKVTPENGEGVEETVTTNRYAYDFAAAVAGKYKVEVTYSGHTATAYYLNKGLARVSVFRVTGNTVQFNRVKNATKYTVDVVCGTFGHRHVGVEVSGEAYDFGDCELTDEGITFVVKAYADGYLTSESLPYTFNRILDGVTGLSVDPSTETVTWDAVAGASYYRVTVKAGTGAAEELSVPATERSLSLRGYAAGGITVEVAAAAHGWNSAAAATVTYNKTRLAAPTEVRVENGILTWEAVAGASGYDVLLDGASVQHVTEAKFALTGQTGTLTVRATAADANKNSLESEGVTVSGALGELTYSQGKVKWDYVSGASVYHIKVTNGTRTATYDVEGANEWKAIFPDSGENTVSVWTADESAAKTIKVVAYKIEFDSQNGSIVAPRYAAVGDPVDLPDEGEVTRAGYRFSGWYKAPAHGGLHYTDTYFAEDGDIKLYAGWVGEQYTVTVDAGEHSDDVFETVGVTYGERYDLPVPKTNDTTLVFRGWYLTADATSTQFTDETGASLSPYMVLGDVTMHAVWAEIFAFSATTGGGWAVSKNAENIGLVQEVTIPATYLDKPVTDVLDFSGCSTLTAINIPSTVKSVVLGGVGSAFASCYNLKNINIYEPEEDTDNDTVLYASADGVLFYFNADVGRTELAYYPFARTERSYTVPATVLFADGNARRVDTIPQGAFYTTFGRYGSLTSIVLPETISLIEANAFYYYRYLSNVVFEDTTGGEVEPASSLDIRASAFGSSSSNAARLTEITLPQRLSAIAYDSISSVPTLERVHVSGSGVYREEDGLLVKAENSELVFYPIGRADTSYIIPAGVSAIGERAFYGNSVLKEITIPGHVVSIGESAFEGCSALDTLVFGGRDSDSGLTIAARAFYGPTRLTSVTLPRNLASLGQYAFGGSSRLFEATVDTGAEVEIADGAFLSAADYGYVKTVRIGANAPVFSIAAVFGQKVEHVAVDPANGNYFTDTATEAVYNEDKTQILFVPSGITAITLPGTVTEIPANTFREKMNLREITIPKSIVSIGDGAFYDCRRLETVTFEGGGESALTIGNSAFYNCSLLSTIVLPDRLTSVGESAFVNCSALTAVNIPRDLEVIGGSGTAFAFYNLTRLAAFTADPANTHYKVTDNILYAVRAAQEGGAVKYVEDVLLLCPMGNRSARVTVPATVTSVAEYAFYRVSSLARLSFADSKKTVSPAGQEEGGTITIAQTALSACYGLTEIDLPHGLGLLNMSMFAGLNGLKKLVIPNTVTTISAAGSNLALTAAERSGITEIEFESGNDSASLAISNGVGATGAVNQNGAVFRYFTQLISVHFPKRLTTIGSYAFYNLKHLREVTFAADAGSLSIGNYAFWGNLALTEIALPEKTSTIGDRAFAQSGLRSVVIPASVTSIGQYAFNACAAVTGDLIIPAKVKTIGNYAFTGTGISSVTFQGSDGAASALTSVGTHCFENCIHLASVTFQAMGADFTIGDYAFNGCVALTGATLSEQLTSIGANAFAGCYKLTSVSFGAEGTTSKLAKIGNSAFSLTGFTEFVFPETTGALSLGTTLFSGCSIGNVYLSSTVGNVVGVFDGCLLDTVTIDPGNKNFTAADKEVWTSGSNKLLQVVYGTVGDTFTTPAGMLAIPDSLYKEHPEIKTLVLAASVTSIGASSFANCINLEKVVIPEGSALASIGASAFAGCTKLAAIDLQNARSLRSVGDKAFMGVAVEDYTFGEGLTDIGKYAFENSAVKTVDLSKASSMTTVGTYAFSAENTAKIGIEKVNLPLGITFIGTFAFNNASSLTTVGTAESVEALEEGTCDLSKLGIKYFGSTATAAPAATVNTSQFVGCAFTKLILPKDLTHVGGHTFQSCKQLTEIEGFEHVTLIGDYSFSSTAITEVTIPAGMTYLGSVSFGNCASLSQVTFEEGNRSAASLLSHSQVFQNCTALKTIDFTPISGITSFGLSCFSGSGLTRLDLSMCTALRAINAGAFNACADLEEIIFPAGLTGFTASTLTGIGGAFSKCTSLEKVDLSKCYALVGLGATVNDSAQTFSGCTALSEVILPEHEIVIGKEAFRDCVSLTEEGIDLSNVIGIGSYAFANTGFTELTLPTSVRGWYSYDKNIGNAGSESDSGTLINYVFANCLALRKVIIPEGTTRLAQHMFDGCSALEEIEIADGFAGYEGALGDNVFQNTGLTSADLSKTALTSIGIQAFADCTSLKEVLLPATVTLINSGAFAHTGLQSIDLSGLTEFRKFGGLSTSNTLTAAGAFEGCDQLTEVILPKTETFVVPGRYTFKDCVRLGSIDYRGTGVTAFTADGPGAEKDYTYSVGTEMLDPSELTATESHIFEGCTGLTEFFAPEGLTVIGGYAFDGCASLGSFDFGGVTHIGVYAFRGTALKEIELDAGTVYLGSGSRATATAAETLASSPFTDCGNLTSVRFASDEENGRRYNAEKTYYTVGDKMLVSAGASDSILFLAGKAVFENGTLDLSGGNITLGYQALAGVSGITRVILPEGMTEIPAYAFYGSSIAAIDLPDGLTSIGEYAFAGSALTEISIPSSVVSIGAAAFYDCADLETVTFEEGGDRMFWGDGTQVSTAANATLGTPGVFEASGIKNITVPDRVPTVSIRAFRGVNAQFTFAAGVQEFASYAFYGIGNTTFEIPASVKKIGAYCFATSALTEIVLPATLETVGWYSFSRCESLVSASVNGEYNYINSSDGSTTSCYLFDRCTALENVTLSDDVTTIGGYMFYGAAFREFTVPGHVRLVRTWAFRECRNLETVKFEEGVKSLDAAYLFAGCEALKTVELASSISFINASTFIGTSTLTVAIDEVRCRGNAYDMIKHCGTAWMSPIPTVTFGYTGE